MTYEYAVEWGYDRHVHGGYAKPSLTVEGALDNFGRDLYNHWHCDVVRRKAGTDDKWEYIEAIQPKTDRDGKLLKA